METHEPSSLAGAGYNATQSDESVSVSHHFSGNGCEGSNMGLVGHSGTLTLRQQRYKTLEEKLPFAHIAAADNNNNNNTPGIQMHSRLELSDGAKKAAAHFAAGASRAAIVTAGAPS